MSGKCRDEVTTLLETLWGNDMQQWNHGQHTMAEEVNRLFLGTTSIKKSELMQRINRLITQNPEVCRGNGGGEASTSSRATEPPRTHTSKDETRETPKSFKKQRGRISRLRDQIIWNVHHLVHGEAPDAHQVNPEFLGMEEPFGSVYDRLAKIHGCQQLLHTKLIELDDAHSSTRIKDEAIRWDVGKSAEDEEKLLDQIQQALESLETVTIETEQAKMTSAQTKSAIHNLRLHLGKNNFKIFWGTEPRISGGTVDLNGPRAQKFRELLSCQDRQFNVARLLAELDSEDVRGRYQAFVKEFADLWAQKGGTWSAAESDQYEEGLMKQENLVSQALKSKTQRKTAVQQLSVSGRPQIAGKPTHSLSSSHLHGNQAPEQRTQTRGRRTGTASSPRTQPKRTEGVSKQSKERTTQTLASQRLHGKSAKLNVRLDLAGSDDTKTSRHLRWSPDDTRDLFFHKMAELFPGRLIQQVSTHLHGGPVNVQATGPEGEWEIVQEEWMERLAKPSKKLKEPSAEVHLAELNE